MEGFFMIQANTGRALRVVRRGFHMVIEQRGKQGDWEGVHRIEIEDHDEPGAALRGAVRKCLYLADDFAQLGVVLSMLKQSDSKDTFAELIALAHLPRDAMLSARIPSLLKTQLLSGAERLAKRSRLNRVTISDYLIYRLGSGDDIQ